MEIDYTAYVTAASERLIPLLLLWAVNKGYAKDNDEDLGCKEDCPTILYKAF